MSDVLTLADIENAKRIIRENKPLEVHDIFIPNELVQYAFESGRAPYSVLNGPFPIVAAKAYPDR